MKCLLDIAGGSSAPIPNFGSPNFGLWTLLALTSLMVGLGCSRIDDRDDDWARDVFSKTQPSIVKIYAISRDGSGRVGSGFVSNLEPDTVILTSKHLTEGAEVIILENEDYVWIPDGWKEHPSLDISVVPLGDREPPPSLELSRGGEIQVGQKIATVGYPLGDSIAVHEGIVSSLDGLNVIFSAPLSTGASGSPLLNRGGRVVGVCYSFVTNAQNYNLAIPSELLLIETRWISKKADLDKPLRSYIKAISRAKNFRKKNLGEWDRIGQEYPQLSDWIRRTGLTRRNLIGAVEGVVVAVHSIEWADAEGGKINKLEVERLRKKLTEMKDAVELHSRNSEGAGVEANSGALPLLAGDRRRLESFVAAAEALSENLEDGLSGRVNGTTEWEVRDRVLNYLREEVQLFSAGIP